MAISFSQTLESRHYDISRLFMIGMLVAVPFSVLWGYWFCTASVPVYETTRQFSVSDNELIRKAFPRTGGGGMRTQSLKSRKIFAVFSAKAGKNITRYQQGYFFPEAKKIKRPGLFCLQFLRLSLDVPVKMIGSSYWQNTLPIKQILLPIKQKEKSALLSGKQLR